MNPDDCIGHSGPVFLFRSDEGFLHALGLVPARLSRCSDGGQVRACGFRLPLAGTGACHVPAGDDSNGWRLLLIPKPARLEICKRRRESCRIIIFICLACL